MAGSNGSSERFDVIVVGAGIAGLAAAAKMQRRGAKVLLLEQHEIVGGYCTNWKRGDYEFDTAIHCVAGCEPGGDLYEILAECGAERYVDFIPLEPYLYKAVFPDRVLNVPSNLEAFAEMLDREYPSERGVRDYFKAMERIYETVDLIGDKNVSPIKKILAPFTSPRGFYGLMRHMNSSYGDFLASFIADREVRKVVSQLWGFFGAPPSRLSLPVFVMGFMSYYKQGAYYIRGGSQKLSDAFAKAFVENGGVLRVNADAVSIGVDDGVAQSVRVRDQNSGDEVTYFANTILSCADATHTLRDLVGLENVPPNLRQRLDDMVPASSAFVLYLGVDMEMPEEFAGDFDVLVNGSGDAEKAYNEMLAGERFDDFAMTFYSNLEPALSPEPGKKHVIVLLSMMNLEEEAMRRRWGTDAIETRGKEYRRIKNEYADRLLHQADLVLPGLSDHVEVMSVATPVTMKRYTRNLNGSIMGWENSPQQSMFRRMQHATPIKNLYMASAWTFPGGGVNGATLGGSTAADTILKSLSSSTRGLPTARTHVHRRAQ